MNRRIHYYLPLILASFLGNFFIQAQELTPDEFRKVLDPYVGVWQGEYRIYSQDDTLLNQFKVNRNYWWDGSVLLGRVSYDFGQIKQTYFHRMILSDGVPFSFVTDTANSDEVRSALKGEFLRGTQVWSRVLPKGSLPVRISERIVSSDEGKFLEFWGNQEAKDTDGKSLLVRIEGFAAYVPDSREFVVAVDEVEPAEESKAVPTVKEKEKKTEKKRDVKNRDQRMQSLDPDRRATAAQDDRPQLETAFAEIPESVEPVTQEPQASGSPSSEPAATVTGTTPPAVVLKERNEPKTVAVADPDIETALNSLNIVGINDKAGEQCIVVDYFLLYEIGDRLDMDKDCNFTAIDTQYLYFEDAEGYQYRIFRKDALSQ